MEREPRLPAEHQGIAGGKPQRAGRVLAGRAADPKQAGVAERKRDHGGGEVLLVAVLVQAQPAAALFTLPAQTLDDVREAQKRGPVEVIAYDRDNRNALSSGTLATIESG